MRHVLYLPSHSDVAVFVLLILLCVSVMAIDRLDDDASMVGWLAQAFAPFRSLSYRLMNLSFVHKENQILRAQLMDVARDNALLREQVHEAARLRELLDFEVSHPGTLRCARVVGEPGERMGGGIVIDKGSAARVAKNMTVISPDGLVGRIIRVAPGASVVRRIIDPGHKVSALIRRNRAAGILEAKSDGKLVMEWVAPDAEVVPGDTVVSSGLGSITPKGIVIGVVKGVERKPERFSLAVEVVPVTDFSRLEEVFVLLRQPPDFRAVLGDSER